MMEQLQAMMAQGAQGVSEVDIQAVLQYHQMMSQGGGLEEFDGSEYDENDGSEYYDEDYEDDEEDEECEYDDEEQDTYPEEQYHPHQQMTEQPPGSITSSQGYYTGSSFVGGSQAPSEVSSGEDYQHIMLMQQQLLMQQQHHGEPPGDVAAMAAQLQYLQNKVRAQAWRDSRNFVWEFFFSIFL